MKLDWWGACLECVCMCWVGWLAGWLMIGKCLVCYVLLVQVGKAVIIVGAVIRGNQQMEEGNSKCFNLNLFFFLIEGERTSRKTWVHSCLESPLLGHFNMHRITDELEWCSRVSLILTLHTYISHIAKNSSFLLIRHMHAYTYAFQCIGEDVMRMCTFVHLTCICIWMYVCGI